MRWGALIVGLCLVAGCLTRTADLPPLGELCNGLDDDGDGRVDEDAPARMCPPLEAFRDTVVESACIDAACVVARCSAGRSDVDGVYETGCEGFCTPQASPIDVCLSEQHPLAARIAGCRQNCNFIDDDCDGRTEEARAFPVSPRPGVCAGASMVCDPLWREPDYAAIEGYSADEIPCDGLDNDCDGIVDDPDDDCDGIDEDCDGIADEGVACAETLCAAETDLPPCNGCPADTPVPAGWVCVPPGGFVLGSPPDEAGRDAGEGPATVYASRPLLVRIDEVTRGEWLAAFDDAPPADSRCTEPRCPITGITWFEAVAYANHLATAAGLTPCHTLHDCHGAPGRGMVCDGVEAAAVDCTGHRLPTEAEWEHAARAHTATPWSAGATVEALRAVAWFEETSALRAHPVGGLPSNPWGLRDMHGNVWEWTAAWYGAYPADDAVDPQGPPNGPGRVFRGGGYDSRARWLRSAYRAWRAPEDAAPNLGLRPVRALP